MNDHPGDSSGGACADSPDSLAPEEPLQPLDVSIQVESEIWAKTDPELVSALPERVAQIAQLVERLVGPRAVGGSASVVLADDELVAELNAVHRGKSGPTNVLSFPSGVTDLDTGRVYRGDVILACETTVREAESLGRPLSHHVHHLVVHGLMHLFGFDHGDDAAASIMEGHEIAILADLGIANPYQEESDAPAR